MLEGFGIVAIGPFKEEHLILKKYEFDRSFNGIEFLGQSSLTLPLN